MHPKVQKIAEALHISEMSSATVLNTGQNNSVFDTREFIMPGPGMTRRDAILCQRHRLSCSARAKATLSGVRAGMRTVSAYVVAVHRKFLCSPFLSLAGMTDVQKLDLASDLTLFLRVLHTPPCGALPASAHCYFLAELPKFRARSKPRHCHFCLSTPALLSVAALIGFLPMFRPHCARSNMAILALTAS